MLSFNEAQRVLVTSGQSDMSYGAKAIVFDIVAHVARATSRPAWPCPCLVFDAEAVGREVVAFFETLGWDVCYRLEDDRLEFVFGMPRPSAATAN